MTAQPEGDQAPEGKNSNLRINSWWLHGFPMRTTALACRINLAHRQADL
jgi:hypothetical protein